MSQPEPEEYQMLLNLQAALLAMTVASGYYFDMPPGGVKLDANAEVEKLIGENQLRPFIVLDVLPETRTYSPAKRVELVTPVNVYWVHDPADPDDATRLQTYFRGRADVERAIAQDVSRGGLAIDTTIIDTAQSHGIADSSVVVAVIQVQLRRRRVYGSP
jgi:hypothetical protein